MAAKKKTRAQVASVAKETAEHIERARGAVVHQLETTSAKAAEVATVEAALGKLQALRSQLPQAVLERRDVADGLLLALLSGTHLLLLGLPGTAKSLLIRLVCSAVEGGQWFSWLLTKFSTPEELFGPYDLQGLKAGRYERITTGKLPEAHLAFCDEIFKANSAILNSLLTLLEERLFHNGTTAQACPLLSLVGASNELPEDESLAALHDRFLLRYWVDYLQEDDHFLDLLAPSFDASAQVTARLTLEELAVLQVETRKVQVPRTILETILSIRRELAGQGIVASDRRWKGAVRVLQAKALLEGRREVVSSDLLLLAAMLWETRDQLPAIRCAVGEAADPLLADCLGLWDDSKATLREVRAQAPASGADLQENLAYVQVLTEAAGSLKASSDSVYGRLGREGVTLDGASVEVQEAMAGVRSVAQELERLAMAYATRNLGGGR